MQRFLSRVHACSENLIGPIQTGSHQTNQKLVKKMSKRFRARLTVTAKCASDVMTWTRFRQTNRNGGRFEAFVKGIIKYS